MPGQKRAHFGGMATPGSEFQVALKKRHAVLLAGLDLDRPKQVVGVCTFRGVGDDLLELFPGLALVAEAEVPYASGARPVVYAYSVPMDRLYLKVRMDQFVTPEAVGGLQALASGAVPIHTSDLERICYSDDEPFDCGAIFNY